MDKSLLCLLTFVEQLSSDEQKVSFSKYKKSEAVVE